MVAGAGGVPSTGAGAVTLNVTVVGPSAAGYLTVFPSGVGLPTASNLNFTAGEVIPNAVTVGLGAGGRISLFNASGTTPVIVDVTGWMAGTVQSGTFQSWYAGSNIPAGYLANPGPNGGLAHILNDAINSNIYATTPGDYCNAYKTNSQLNNSKQFRSECVHRFERRHALLRLASR